MVITQTPFRVSFFGGGTDYRSFFEEYGGSVISTTIDKYCYVTVRHLPRFFEHSNHIVYSKIEQVNSVSEIQHPLVREAMLYLDMHELSIAYDADLPARSGLGSSSAFAVGLLQAFNALKGKYVSKMKLSQAAVHLERVLCNEAGGEQDQVQAAFGGLNRINFSRNGYNIHPIIISNNRKNSLNEHLMLFFTGFSRLSYEIAIEQQKALSDKTSELKEMLKLVDEAESMLISKCDITEFGRLLDYTWQLKRSLTGNITNESIDTIYKTARQNGAVGGKILGAGGGGFLLIFAKPEYQPGIRKALNDLLYVPFSFENEGSRILHYSYEDWELTTRGEG